jgi:hypothetical protein
VKKMSGFSNSKYVNFKRGALKLKVFRRIWGKLFPLRASEEAD